jgi:uncharacterized protein (DUF111 family)
VPQIENLEASVTTYPHMWWTSLQILNGKIYSRESWSCDSNACDPTNSGSGLLVMEGQTAWPAPAVLVRNLAAVSTVTARP